MKKLTGKCLCEAVQYEINGNLGPIYNCHCSKCRRWHGAAFRTRASINKTQFVWLTGEDNLAFYNSSATVSRSFCKTCGSNLVNYYEDLPDILGIPLGGLEQSPDNSPLAHIFVDSKSPWYKITDDLPQYNKWPGEECAVRATGSFV